MQDNVILYHQETCPQCKMVEMLLKKNNIEYISNKDIDEMTKLGINHTPTLSVNGELKTGKEINPVKQIIHTIIFSTSHTGGSQFG